MTDYHISSVSYLLNFTHTVRWLGCNTQRDEFGSIKGSEKGGNFDEPDEFGWIPTVPLASTRVITAELNEQETS